MTYPHPADLSTGQATISVLVVDDYEDAAEMLGEYIQLACHCSVGVAQNGIEALVAVGAFQPAIIVMDVDMPFMDGIETAVLVRQRAGSKVPILIALTGGPRLADAQTSAHFDHVMCKPANLAALSELLAQSLARGCERLAPTARTVA